MPTRALMSLFLFYPTLFYMACFFCLVGFFNLFLAALGLRCCARAFSSCGKQGLLLAAVCGLLIAVASLAAEHGLLVCGLQ